MLFQFEKDREIPNILTLKLNLPDNLNRLAVYTRIIDHIAHELEHISGTVHLIVSLPPALPPVSETLSIVSYAEERLGSRFGVMVLVSRQSDILSPLASMLLSSSLMKKLYVMCSLEQARQLIMTLERQVVQHASARSK